MSSRLNWRSCSPRAALCFAAASDRRIAPSCTGPPATTASSAPPRTCRSTTTSRPASRSRCRCPASRPPTRATGSASLFVNNGGPGNSAVDFVRVDARDVYTPRCSPASTSSG